MLHAANWHIREKAGFTFLLRRVFLRYGDATFYAFSSGTAPIQAHNFLGNKFTEARGVVE